MIEPTKNLMAVLNARRPDVLYHYTSLAGLDGITTSRSVWATAAQYMNDSKELTLALEIAHRQLDGAYHGESIEGKKRLLEYLRDQLQRMEHFEVCIFALSSRGDLLSQWRGYCPPNGGYSIGFAAEDMRMVVATQGAFLAPCIYDIDVHEVLVKDALRPLLQRLPGEMPQDDKMFREEAEKWSPLLFEQLTLIAPLIKHYAFEEEQEWRVIWVPGRLNVLELNYRVGRGTFIPYADVSLEHKGRKVSVQEIVVGPMRNQYAAINALSGALNAKGFKWRSIRPSQAPYRTW
jgi:hypothetical protein